MLFVDDEPTTLMIFEAICHLRGYQYTGLVDPRQVVRSLDELRPVDIVFLDLAMPNLNGFEILKILRIHPNFKAVPIIACTVHNQYLQQAHDEGFDGFILKPFHLDKFLQSLTFILAGGSVWDTQGG
jgi:twitching motility two-component system response regulator PilG